MKIPIKLSLLIFLSIVNLEATNTQYLEKEKVLNNLENEHIQLLKNIKQLTLENKILKTKFELKELNATNKQYTDTLKYETKLQKLENAAKLAKIKAETKTNEMNVEKSEWELKTEKLASEINILKIKKERANYIDKEAQYLDNPLKKNNTLVISDRRISLNGAITSKMASAITHKINYFNNKNNTRPIFLVIDSSPGGSVMAGYLIVKAMESSEAPVYVVLKSFAASMAAIIVSTAEKSFAYSHATILHHQPSMFQRGSNNLTEQKESYKHLEKWWKYLAIPVAKKMGISINEFQKQMYEHSSKGDWSEFAKDAHKLKWVNHIVNQMEETGILSASIENEEKKESDEKKSMANKHTSISTSYLPRLSPTDAYLIYNPDGYYRTH